MREVDDKASSWVATIVTLLFEVRGYSFDLIADDTQELMGLVKNSCDADASQIYANIKTLALKGADTGDIASEAYPFFATKPIALNHE